MPPNPSNGWQHFPGRRFKLAAGKTVHLHSEEKLARFSTTAAKQLNKFGQQPFRPLDHHVTIAACTLILNALTRRNFMPDSVAGCLFGTAIGDALGLPYEAMNAKRASCLLGPPNRFRFVFGRGMMSDDTEHTCMVAQSLIECGGNPDVFARLLSRRFRWWLVAFPAGMGLATLRACLRLWLCVPPDRSGVHSAGNGPAMRSAILGVCIDDPALLIQFVRASTRLTHTDSRAEAGALVIAIAAQTSRRAQQVTAEEFFRRLRETRSELFKEDSELMQHLCRAAESVEQGISTAEFADSLGRKGFVTGYINHTVPVAIHSWLSHPDDWMHAVQSVIVCGGDADTTAAITGAVTGCRTGRAGIPEPLLKRFCDWPRTTDHIQKLADALTAVHWPPQPENTPVAPGVSALAIVLRNCVFLAVVLFHGLRRLLPPY